MKKYLLLAATTFALNSYAGVADVAKQCDSCHGAGGISTDSRVPTIAGIASINISDALLQYQSEERPAFMMNGTDMVKEAKALDESMIEEIAEYYADKEFVAATQDFIVKMVKPGGKIHMVKCEKCHSGGGAVADDEASILAGQHSEYLRTQFEQFINGERQVDKKMIDALKAMNDKYKDALISFYASQQ